PRRLPDHVRDVRPVLLPDPLHAERPALLAASNRDPVPAGDGCDRLRGSAGGAGYRPPPAPAPRGAWPGDPRRGAADPIPPDDPLELRGSAARLRPDGPGDRARHVADEHGGDERRGPDQGWRRLRRRLDEPDGRRQRRTRGDGRTRYEYRKFK